MAASVSVSSPTLVSKCTIFPDKKSTLEDLKLSVSDLPMLSCHYIQKGGLFTRPNLTIDALVSILKRALSQALSHFPPLAGRLKTDSNGNICVTCNDAGAEFVHKSATEFFIRDIIAPIHVPEIVKSFFALDRTISHDGHCKPLMTVQVTELADGVFISCAVNHAVTDGTSFWNFFNTFAELSRGIKRISKQPDFSRDSVLISPAILRIPVSGLKVTFNEYEALSERIFSFSRESILKLKARANKKKWVDNGDIDAVELMGKQSNDPYCNMLFKKKESNVEISSFQSLGALLWRAVTRARKLHVSKTTTFRMAVNCRHRLNPKLDPLYFGNAIQSIPTYASAGDVVSKDLRWCAEQLNKNVNAHDDKTVRRFVEDWESNPRVFPLGNFDGASMTMGSSPRFPMYDNDFGWGRPLAVRSGNANKFDGKISAFPGREGGGSVDLEVVLAPETMAGIESDYEFMQFVSS
ncbi:uncharacterized acetyltransferase At3g50280-like [Mangifera indica]|uniref:uncharacterized acetyltransferase At3g50280-like n=1 Tax=Mangifera indica TaxID=29780 RepID=UPI001CF96427|nr:uncharacterized acetyltransferase At3g50280-like [Mangifera indica]